MMGIYSNSKYWDKMHVPHAIHIYSRKCVFEESFSHNVKIWKIVPLRTYCSVHVSCLHQTIHYFIYRVMALDADTSVEYSQITYWLSSEDSVVHQKFMVEHTSGIIYLTQPLDYDPPNSQQSFEFTVSTKKWYLCLGFIVVVQCNLSKINASVIRLHSTQLDAAKVANFLFCCGGFM